MATMTRKRINLGLAPAMYKDLQKLAEQEGFDLTNAIRYCIRYTCDSKLVSHRTPRGKEPEE
jgi:hypothetical protein